MPDSVKAMVDQTLETFGSIDILVNNAGITRDNLLMRMKDDEWDDVININLKGVFLCTKGVTRQMMRQRAGKIVNVASIVGVSGNRGKQTMSLQKRVSSALRRRLPKSLLHVTSMSMQWHQALLQRI